MHVQVTQEDLQRVAAATGAAVQTTVNNLNTKCLGTCKAFEERQVRHRIAGSWCEFMQRCSVLCTLCIQCSLKCALSGLQPVCLMVYAL